MNRVAVGGKTRRSQQGVWRPRQVLRDDFGSHARGNEGHLEHETCSREVATDFPTSGLSQLACLWSTGDDSLDEGAHTYVPEDNAEGKVQILSTSVGTARRRGHFYRLRRRQRTEGR